VDETVDRMSFSEDLKAVKDAVIPHVDVPLTINGNAHTMRVRRADALDWVDAVDRSPLRPDAPYDRLYGYNLRQAARLVLPKCAVLLVDGDEQQLRVDPVVPGKDDPDRVDEWADLFKALSGHFESKLGDAVYALNEHASEASLKAALAALKKAQGGSRKKSA
jgi:hypothetical protein